MPDKPTTDSETHASTNAVTSTWKVLGKLKDSAATGILGRNTSTTGQTTGVEGLSDSAGTGSAGVRGTATATTGEVFGVQGVNKSGRELSAALDGYAPNGGAALIAEADNQWGGWVHTNEADRVGIYGGSLATSGSGVGVYGYTRSTDNSATGVYGTDTGGSGATYGVHGETFSSNGSAAGVLGESSGSNSPAVRAKGDLDVTGSASIREVGIDVYLSSDVSVDDSPTTIVFDQKRHDDLGEYDTTTGEFSPARDGDYLVTVQVDWDATDASSGDEYFLDVIKNGGTYVSNNSAADTGLGQSQNISIVMRDLTTSDTVSIEADSDSSDNTTKVTGVEALTWFQVSKIA